MNHVFWDKVDASGDCWLWVAGRNNKGYGVSYVNGRTSPVVAHRWAYETLVGPIPVGFQLDHLCRVTACVNPDHLQPVTSGENTRRGHGPSALNARKTTCPQGHPIVRPYGVWCRECKRLKDRQRDRRKR